MFVAKLYSAMQTAGYAGVILTILCFLINGNLSEIPPKSVNLAIETSFLLEPHELKQNFSALNNLQNFLDKLQNQLTPNVHQPVFRSRKSEKSKFSNLDLTEFVKELGILLLNYEENDLRTLILALKEILGWKSKDPTFLDIFGNDQLKTITNKVNELANENPLRIKVDISKYLTRKETETTPFSDFIRKLSRVTYQQKLESLLDSFKTAQETKGFAKPVENSFIYIFDQWNNMDYLSKIKAAKLLFKLIGNDENEFILPKRRHHRRNNINDELDFSESLQDNGTFSDNSINIETVLELNKNIQFSVSSNFNNDGTKDVGDKKTLLNKEHRANDREP